MADTYTTNLNLTKPEPGAAEDTWGISLNADLDALDAIFSSSGTQINLNPNQINFADGKKAVFGNSSDLQIYHNGSNSYIHDSGTGDLRVLATNFRLLNADENANIIRAFTGAEVELYYNGSEKLATTSSGIDVTGNIQVSGNVNASLVSANNISGQVLQINNTTVVDSSRNLTNIGTISSGAITSTGAISAEDNIYLTDATTIRGRIELNASDRDDLDIVAVSLSSNLKFFTQNTEVGRFDASGNLLVSTTNTAPATNNVAGISLRNEGHINVSRASGVVGYFNRITNDGEIIRFNKDGSSVGSIGTNSGQLFIGNEDGSTDTGLLFGESGTTARAIIPARADGSVVDGALDLGYSSGRFKDLHLSGTISSGAITSTGNSQMANLVVTGDLTVQGTTTTIDTTNLDVKDKNITLNYGTGDTSANANGAGITIQDAVSATEDATLTWNTANDSFNFSHPLNVTGNISSSADISASSFTASSSGYGTIELGGVSGAYIDLKRPNTDDFDLRLITTGTGGQINAPTGATIDLQINTSDILSVSSTGIDVTGNANFGDNDKAQFGDDNDLQIYHDGNNSRVEDTGTGGLRLIGGNFVSLQSTSGENMVVATENGAVTLYHNNNAKLATTSSGIDVTGTIDSGAITSSGKIETSSRFVSTAGISRFQGGIALGSDNDVYFYESSAGQATLRTGSSGAYKYFSSRTDGYFLAPNGYMVGSTVIVDGSRNLTNIGTISSGVLSVNGGTTNVVATFQSTDGIAGIKLQDSGGNVELSASGSTFRVQPSGGTPVLEVDSLGDLTIQGGRIYLKESDLGNNAVAITRDADEGYLQLFSSGSQTVELRGNGNSYINGGSLGIGINSPNFKLHLKDGTSTAVYQQFSNDTTGNTSSDGTVLGIDADGDFLINNQESKTIKLYTADTERLRITSAGSVLVGTTDSSPYNNNANTSADNGIALGNAGNAYIARYNFAPLDLNRTGSDGDIIAFRKSGSIVGGIGVDSTDNLYIAGGSGSTKGLYFNDAGVIPATTGGGVVNNAVDLGQSGYRFKDLYLSSRTIIGDGSNSAPAYTFGSDADTGMYRVSTNALAFATGGTERWRITSSGTLQGSGTITSGAITSSGGFTATIGGIHVADGVTFGQGDHFLGDEGGQNDSEVLVLRTGASASSAALKLIAGYGQGGDTSGKIQLYTNGSTSSPKLEIDIDGNIKMGSTQIISGGSRNLTNIGTITSGAITAKSSGSTTDQISLVHSGNTVKIASLGQESNHGSLILRNNSGVNQVRLSAGGNNSYLLNSNFGIGTTTVIGKVHADDSGGATLTLTRTSGATSGNLGKIRFGNTNVDSDLASIVAIQDGATNNSALTFGTQTAGYAVAEAMRLDSSQNATFAGDITTSYGVSAGYFKIGSTVIVNANRDLTNIGNATFAGTISAAYNGGSQPTFTVDATGDVECNTFTALGTAQIDGQLSSGESFSFTGGGQIRDAKSSSTNPILTVKNYSSTNTDGTYVDFLTNNDSLRGSIGTRESESNTNLYIIGSSGTYQTGLKFLSFQSYRAIYPAGAEGATTDNTIDLGYSSGRFQDIYATNGTIQTSDKNEKQDIQALTEAEQRVATACKGLIRRFRWQDAVEKKDNNPDSDLTARYHFGVMAQDLQDAFETEGLDAGDYGMFISSTWTDDEGNEQTRLGVRYNELLAFIITTL